MIPLDPAHPASGAERALLERLQERRQELARARELDIRENLIKAAEKRLEAKLAEIKDTEARITVAMEKKDEAEAARMKGLVTMYENMKPRDAAKISTGSTSRSCSTSRPRSIRGACPTSWRKCRPESAERLTVEIANRAKQPDKDRRRRCRRSKAGSTGSSARSV